MLQHLICYSFSYYMNYSLHLALIFLHLLLQLLRPIYKQIAENQNAEIFSANTLLVILGTSLLTARVLDAFHNYYYSFLIPIKLCLPFFLKKKSFFLNRQAFPWHWEHFWLVCFLQKLNFPYRLNQILLHIVAFYWVSSS